MYTAHTGTNADRGAAWEDTCLSAFNMFKFLLEVFRALDISCGYITEFPTTPPTPPPWNVCKQPVHHGPSGIMSVLPGQIPELRGFGHWQLDVARALVACGVAVFPESRVFFSILGSLLSCSEWTMSANKPAVSPSMTWLIIIITILIIASWRWVIDHCHWYIIQQPDQIKVTYSSKLNCIKKQKSCHEVFCGQDQQL